MAGQQQSLQDAQDGQLLAQETAQQATSEVDSLQQQRQDLQKDLTAAEEELKASVKVLALTWLLLLDQA